MHNLEILKEENKELKDALTWIIEQFEKVLSGQKAGNVVESISYAKSLIDKKYNIIKEDDVYDYDKIPVNIFINFESNQIIRFNNDYYVILVSGLVLFAKLFSLSHEEYLTFEDLINRKMVMKIMPDINTK